MWGAPNDPSVPRSPSVHPSATHARRHAGRENVMVNSNWGLRALLEQDQQYDIVHTDCSTNMFILLILPKWKLLLNLLIFSWEILLEPAVSLTEHHIVGNNIERQPCYKGESNQETDFEKCELTQRMRSGNVPRPSPACAFLACRCSYRWNMHTKNLARTLSGTQDVTGDGFWQWNIEIYR